MSQALKMFDCVKSEGMHFVESWCWKLNVGFVQYLLELNMWWEKKLLWQQVVCWKMGHPVKAKYIHCLSQACQISNPLVVSLLQATLAVQEATSQYLSLKPPHDFLHSVFLQPWLWDSSLSEENHKVIATLISLEALWELYCHICAIQNHSAGHSISSVEYSSPLGTVLATCCTASSGSSLKHSPKSPPHWCPLVTISQAAPCSFSWSIWDRSSCQGDPDWFLPLST